MVWTTPVRSKQICGGQSSEEEDRDDGNGHEDDPGQVVGRGHDVPFTVGGQL
jgi:hypothetical protein